jgi:hypothetical protein
MQPFDDRTPEEIDARNAAIITFLGRMYEQSKVEDSEPVETDSIPTPSQEQAVANVRQRLLQLAHDNRSPAARETPASKSINNRMPLPGQKTSWRWRLNVLALVTVMVALIGSSIFVFGLARQQKLEQGSVSQTPASSSIKPSGQGNLLIGDMLQADQASRYLLQKQQFTQLNQSQMVDGYQVTLDRAYVDGNLLIMGVYAVMPYGPQADKGDLKTGHFMTPENNHVRLTTASGVQLPVLGFSNAENVGDKQHLLRGLLLGFDAAGIQGKPAQVTFKLQMDVRCQGLSPNYQCPRTMNFSLTLPFHASRRVVTPHQSVTMNGTTFTLERVVITPSEARFYIGGWSAALLAPSTAWKQTPQPESFDDTWYKVKLTVQGKTRDLCTFMDPTDCPQGARMGASVPLHPTTWLESDSEANAVYLNNDHTIFGFSLLEPFNEHGKATITIHKQLEHYVRNKDQNDGSYTGNPGPVNDKNSSPWTFEFTLP